MAHHKRKRPKHLRNGCLYCKSYKDERGAKIERFPVNAQRVLRANDETDDLTMEQARLEVDEPTQMT